MQCWHTNDPNRWTTKKMMPAITRRENGSSTTSDHRDSILTLGNEDAIQRKRTKARTAAAQGMDKMRNRMTTEKKKGSVAGCTILPAMTTMRKMTEKQTVILRSE
jgi:hypothetical protein